MNCILRGVRVIDPSAGIDRPGQDVWLSEGRIIAIYRHIGEGTNQVIDLTPPPGQPPCVLAPAFIDLHAHLREPGGEAAETIRSGTAAAAAGGFGQVLAMANTQPVIDTPERVREAVARGKGAAVGVHVTAAVSEGQQGRQLVDIAGCVAAGAAAFSDDGRNAGGPALLTDALRAAAPHHRPVLVHPEDESMLQSHGEGVSRCLERPPEVEVSAVQTALNALRAAGRGHLHLQHLSVARSIELLSAARDEGLRVTAEVTPHHLSMWLPASEPPDPASLLKVNPPLRTEGDREAMVQALRQGVIDAVATDHAPHPDAAKAAGLAAAAPGMTGLETALAACITIGGMDGDWLPVLVQRLTTGPYAVVIDSATEPRLRVGAAASFTLFDPAAEWVVGAAPPLSRSRNTPLWGARLRGRVLMTMMAGVIVHSDRTRIGLPAPLAGVHD